jgi:membrane protein YqaA with SNARE-associated domain|tara:strand:+ start:1318 stop:1737 length:420 start_codon:yes stop_codon:yes gene_type:complete
MTGYFVLFLISFLAATIFPLSSELTLIGLLKSGSYNSHLLIGISSLGNILGSVFNWFLGFYLLKYINKKWFPFKQNQINLASKRFNKFGIWSLLFSWLPVIGDPLTLIAGILRVNFLLFLILVTIGKTSRYFFIYFLVN